MSWTSYVTISVRSEAKDTCSSNPKPPLSWDLNDSEFYHQIDPEICINVWNTQKSSIFSGSKVGPIIFFLHNCNKYLHQLLHWLPGLCVLTKTRVWELPTQTMAATLPDGSAPHHHKSYSAIIRGMWQRAKAVNMALQIHQILIWWSIHGTFCQVQHSTTPCVEGVYIIFSYVQMGGENRTEQCFVAW